MSKIVRFGAIGSMAALSGCAGAAASPGKIAKTKDALVLSSAVCPTFTVMTGPVTISGASGDLGPEYSPRCVQVAPGTTVTIRADSAHPLTELDLEDSSDSPNPFVEPTGAGYETDRTAVLDGEGMYGFRCTVHGDEITGERMTGVISVVAPPGP